MLPDPISKGMQFLTELDINEDNVLQFPTVVTGGKGPPSDWWLMDVAIGTVFLARPKNDKHNFVCGEFALYERYEKCACLLSISKDGTQPLHVDMRRFSIQFELVEVIKVIPQNQLGRPVNEPVEPTVGE